MADLSSQLRPIFAQKVTLPGDAAYDQLRQMFYGGLDLHPAAIICPESTADVQQAVKTTQQLKVPFAVRSGGHSLLGHSSVNDGIVLDLRKMKKIEIDAPNYVAWVETGLTAAEVSNELDKQNFVLGFGDTGSVGVGGITLGGGIGYLTRKFGLTIDNVIAAEIVTADGEVRMIDAGHDPELFWAIRGGGGNFGVVTKFKFALHKLTEAFGGLLILPATADNLVRYMEFAQRAPDEFSSILNIMPCPPMPFLPREVHGQMIMMGIIMYAGDPQKGEELLAPLRQMSPLADMLKPMRYKDIFFPEDPKYHPLAVSTNMFLHRVDKNLAETIFAQLNASDAAMRAVQLRVMGGAAAKIAPEATAFAHRQSEIMVNVASFYTGPEDKQKRQDWVTQTAQLLDQGDSAVYVNFVSEADPKWLHAAYPPQTWARLGAVKKQYDPQNFFNSTYNIQ